MIEEKLIEIGFSSNEVKVYLELLKIGSQAVSTLALRLGLNRTTAYSILESLEHKGMVASCRNNNVKIFLANDPNCIIGYLDRRSRAFDYYKSDLLSVMQEFRAITEKYVFKKPVVSYFDGIEGVKHVMYDALTATDDFRAYLCLHKWFASGLKDFLIDYKDYRISKRQVPLKALAPNTPEVRAFFNDHYGRDSGMTEVLYVRDYKKLGIFENETNIYNDKVAMLNLDKGSEYGVVIESTEVASVQRGIFDMIWSRHQFWGEKVVY